ncbi:unnamed protein product [Urochloa humidicola]
MFIWTCSSSSFRPTTTSFESYRFDFGINASLPLRYSRPGVAANPSARPATRTSWMDWPARAKPSWMHRPSPAAALAAESGSGPTSMGSASHRPTTTLPSV